MQRLLAAFLGCLLLAGPAWANSTPGNLGVATTSLTSGKLPFDQGPGTDTALGFNTSYFGVSGGNLILVAAGITLDRIASQTANTILGATSTGSPTALAISSCSTATSALTWTTGSGFGCNSISGSGTGSGVDGGSNFTSVTGTGAISGTPNIVKIASGWTTGTLTLPQISALTNPNDHTVCIEDSKNFISGSATLTIAANGTTPDTVNGAASVGALTTAGASLCFIPNNTAHNWTIVGGTLATSTAPSHQFASSVTINGLGYTQPACGDLSNSSTGCSSSSTKTAEIGWIATVNPNNATVWVAPANATLVSIVGAVETATGSAATVSVNVASSGTACSAGTTVHSGSFNANGTAATNQTLTLTTTAITSAQRLCLQTTGTTAWTSGTGIGGLTVAYTIP